MTRVLGAGIGLAFCRDVMTSFGGTIDCISVHGEFPNSNSISLPHENYAIQPFHFPTTVAFVDDSLQFLSNLSLQLDSRLAYRLYHSPFAALVALNGSARMPPVAERFFSLYRHRGDKSVTRHVIDVSLDMIHREVHNEHRFEQVSVVVVDYDMPEIDGLEFCRNLKNKAHEEDPAHRQGRRTDRRARLQREDHRPLHPQAGRRCHGS
jgi:CheY-like chemotaxis protein